MQFMNYLLPILYILGLYSAYLAGFIYLRSRSTQPFKTTEFHLPWVTVLLVIAIALPTTLQFFFPAILSILQRDYARFLEGKWWRLITPLFVQDGGVSGAIFNLVSLVFVGTVAEQLWDSRKLLMIFFIGGIISELVGFTWQPIGAGNSVANFSLAASIAVAWFRHNPPKPVQMAALLALGADVMLVALREIHGPAALAGAILAFILSQRWHREGEGL
jgi:membrane associated rhomboid family serine protease